MQVLPSIYIAESNLGGRGVFSNLEIEEGTLIEVSPVIVIPPNEVEHIHATKLHDYYFIWGQNDDKCAIVLGYGSLYNHAYKPNAEYFPDFKKDTLSFYALKDISVGEEITVNYSGTPSDQKEFWFDVKNNR